MNALDIVKRDFIEQMGKFMKKNIQQTTSIMVQLMNMIQNHKEQEKEPIIKYSYSS
jgi:hypothetical protein